MADYELNAAILLRLSLIGQPLPTSNVGGVGHRLVDPLLARQRELGRLLEHRLCPADERVQAFLDGYLHDTSVQPSIPRRTLILDQPGLARGLSLPYDSDEFHSPWLASYRLVNGVLHNPANDRRTTKGVFHIVEDGLTIPDDKKAVPREVFARLLDKAFNPPEEVMELPFTANQEDKARAFVSLLLRPIVTPAVPGRTREKTMEIRFIAPGGLVCNLDFVEGIFGNAGDPQLPENDAALDPLHWTGHTGMVVLAPQLTTVTKAELGLPHWDEATDRQRRDGMAWKEEGELYNDGQAFKLCARDERGVIVTIIADNYFGYCKKEVKTQIGYAANLLGGSEEEHAGGAEVYPAWNLASEWTYQDCPDDYSVDDVVNREPERFEKQPEGHAIDKTDPNLIIVPGGATYSMRTRDVTWGSDDHQHAIPLDAGITYMAPDGYRVYSKHREADEKQWHLVGISPRSTQCHKPATVSGGGKSEISKSLMDGFVFGNSYVPDFAANIDDVQALIDRDYSNRFADPERNGKDHRPILSDERTLGSVIKLFTPRSEYSAEYNEFLREIPAPVKELLFTVKRYWTPAWGDDWRSHFSVPTMNGQQGNAISLDGEQVMVNMLRVGFSEDGSWRLFTLRPDFSPAVKVQTEDDITASTVQRPWDDDAGMPRKYVKNCEQLLFQRPDDAIHRGYDKQTELDMSKPGTFISNFEPLSRADARELRRDAQAFSEYTQPMRDLIDKVAKIGDTDTSVPLWFVCSSEPRIVDGKRSKNPRYLQVRPDVQHPELTEMATVSAALRAKIPTTQPAPLPVDIVAAGRRNNPPEEGIPALCSYNPLHFMELPELFMEFISSMTGKSPSTTGAGSEGAMTKAPFNAMPATMDLNSALLSFALTGYDGWLSSAGYIGPKVQVAHDISMLIPELFSRMSEEERDAHRLIEDGCLEPLQDFEYDGQQVLASRLGYRINDKFVSNYFGRIFLHPDSVFTEEILKPELQDLAIFADSVNVITTTHRRVAQAYFDDGTIELACPPLRGLLEIMANGQTADGLTLNDPAFRAQFDRDAIMSSDWYAARLNSKQVDDTRRIQKGIADLREFIKAKQNQDTVNRVKLTERLTEAEQELAYVSSADYLKTLRGTIGREPRFA